MMKEKNLIPRLLYPTRISFRFDGEIKTFTDRGERERKIGREKMGKNGGEMLEEVRLQCLSIKDM